jgi:4-aminobutyrate aminotransferase-like enzyme
MIRNHIIYTSFSDWRIRVTRAEGSSIWDQDGNQLIDFTSSWNVTNLGWNHPQLQQAAIEQMQKNAYAPLWGSDLVQEQYAEALVKSLPAGLTAIGRATGGTEANEEAIKTAKAFTGRRKILSFNNTYHGQSENTLALGCWSETQLKENPAYHNFVRLDFPRATDNPQENEQILTRFSAQLETALSQSDIAAIVTEAGIISGFGTAFLAPPGFLTEVRRLTKKYGTLLILDEVGTGFSRCGALYGMNLENVTPDIVTFAKGATNGQAVLGTMVTTDEIANATLERTDLISTFGWSPVACAVALKTLQIHQEERLWERAASEGQYLLQTLQDQLQTTRIIDSIYGKGMILGIHFKDTSGALVTKITEQAQQKGLHIVCDVQSTIQLMPALNIPRSVLDQGIDILTTTIKALS